MKNNSKKYSVYLENKSSNLKKTLEYFLAETSNKDVSASEKRVIFLSQIDFWSWEMDELIYSFSSFIERSKAWDSYHGISEALVKNGIIIKSNVNERVKSDRRWANKVLDRIWDDKDKEYKYDWVSRPNSKAAPIESLNETVETWNKLIDICQKIVFHNEALGQRIEANCLAGLDEYKKEKMSDAEKIPS